MAKRIFSLFLALSIILSCFVFSPAVGALEVLSHEDFVAVYGAHINYNSKISANPDGTFKLDVGIYSSYSVSPENVNILSSEDNYYVVDRNGRYLVELWGADGATAVGKGGAGGYVYGIIELKEGDTLYYTLGGEGSKTSVAGHGGGANGGGGYGENGSTTVGGGGGYSALFLFDSDDFSNRYLDADGHIKDKLTPADRTSKYIMIAGGGGGGGSYGADSNATADGGAGGYIGSTSGVLGDGYDVSGTFFSGLDGRSSGTSTQYVGKGGTNVPGERVGTWLDWGMSDQANDWKGTYNLNTEGGAGGSGNYRGGAGGAGFCGGSGGVMSSVILANNVGGGGGGSSFVSSVFSYEDLTDRDDSFRIGRENGKGGGEMHLVYLDEQDDDYLKDMDITLARTPYFYVSDISATGKVWNSETDSYEDKTYAIAYRFVEYATDPEVIEFIIEGVSLAPEKDGNGRDHLDLILTFHPKDEFAGGNNVPLLKDDLIVCTPSDTNYDAVELPLKNYCGYVNVPLNFDVSPVNHTPQGLDPENVAHKVTSLYNDLYASVRSQPDADWRYRFIETIGNHVVTDESGVEITTETVSPDETTRYPISLTVVPKDPPAKNYARLSARVYEKTFVGVSVITIAGSGMDTLNSNVLVYNKALSFALEEEAYTLTLHVSSDSSGSIADNSKIPTFNSISYADGTRESTVTIPITGTYTISIKGGNGGTGGSVNMLGTMGGAGGAGGNITATYILKAGTTLRFFAGANAHDASAAYAGADGGEASYVAVLDSAASGQIKYYLMIASGGGGGGGAYLWVKGKDGTTPTQISNSYTGSIESYNGGKGSNGGSGGGASGSASDNYVYNGETDENVKYSTSGTASLSGAGGSASLVCKAIGAGGNGNKENLKNYTIEADISKYFKVTDLSLELIAGTNGVLTKTIAEVKDGDELLYTRVTATINVDPHLMTTDEILNESVVAGTGGEADDIYKTEYNLSIITTPREGFLGGNDVMFLYASGDNQLKTGMRIAQEGMSDFINVDESRVKDYANVDIPESIISSITAFEVQDKVYIYGGEPVIKNTLVKTLEGMPTLSGWQADYVQLVDPREDTTPLTPDKTTDYDVSVGVAPKYSEPYADTKDAVSARLITKTATVHTDAEVTFEFEGVELVDLQPNAEGKYLIEFSEAGHAAADYNFKIKTEDLGEEHHHHLPSEISISVGDTLLSEGDGYEYNRIDDDNATVSIFANKINGNVTVRVIACHEFVTLYYVYQNEPESNESTTLELQRHFGEAINIEADFMGAGKTLPKDDYEHYDLVWDYGLEDGAVLETMPKQNVWIIGTYVPKTYEITVDYKYENGDKAADSVTKEVSYNSEYHITSPIIEGFSPDKTTVSGLATKNETFEVIYSSTEGQLRIVCLYKDSGEVITDLSDAYFTDGEYTVTLAAGREYNVTMPTLAGFVPDRDTVSGTMTAAGITVYVYYGAETYTVTFDDGVDATENVTKQVKYGETYGYNAETGMYDGLPTPIRVGYQFEGWAFNNRAVDENTTVNATSDHTLVARWKAMTFTLTVNYLKDDGSKAYTSLTETLDFESTYSYDSPSIRGYTPDKPNVSGTVPAQNTVVTVTYNRNTYTVTVQFLYSSNSSPVADTVQLSLKHGETYEVAVPQVAGYYTSPDTTTLTGTVDAANVDIVIYYYKDTPQMNFTVSWSGMNFMYNKGTWNPEKLDYEGGYFIPVDDSNKVTVKNEATSNVQIVAEINFTPASEYDTVDGYFTASNQSTAEKITSMSIAVGKEKTAYLHLDGELDERNIPQNFTIGTCTVTVRGG